MPERTKDCNIMRTIKFQISGKMV